MHKNNHQKGVGGAKYCDERGHTSSKCYKSDVVKQQDLVRCAQIWLQQHAFILYFRGSVTIRSIPHPSGSQIAKIFSYDYGIYKDFALKCLHYIRHNL